MTATQDSGRECGGGVVEPGGPEGWSWELGRVLRDCARCWENVLGSPEEGLGEERTGGGEGGQGRRRMPGERGVSGSWGSGGQLETVPAESQSLDRDAGGEAGRRSHTRTTDGARAAAQGTHRPLPTHHPHPGVSSLARPAFQVSSPGVYHLLMGPLKAQAPQMQRAGRRGTGAQVRGGRGSWWLLLGWVGGPVGWPGPLSKCACRCVCLSVSELVRTGVYV